MGSRCKLSVLYSIRWKSATLQAKSYHQIFLVSFSVVGKGMGFSVRCYPNCHMLLWQSSLQKTWIWPSMWISSIYWKWFQFLCGHNKHERWEIHNSEFKLKNFIRGRDSLVLFYEYRMILFFSSDLLILILITGLCYRFRQSIKRFAEVM